MHSPKMALVCALMSSAALVACGGGGSDTPPAPTSNSNSTSQVQLKTFNGSWKPAQSTCAPARRFTETATGAPLYYAYTHVETTASIEGPEKGLMISSYKLFKTVNCSGTPFSGFDLLMTYTNDGAMTSEAGSQGMKATFTYLPLKGANGGRFALNNLVTGDDSEGAFSKGENYKDVLILKAGSLYLGDDTKLDANGYPTVADSKFQFVPV